MGSLSNIINFDYFDLPETPTFILCNPNNEELFSMGGISERKYNGRYNTFSEISFRADEYVNDTLMPYYDYLTYRRVINVISGSNSLGYFMITETSESSDGISKFKEIKCQSIEVELVTKKVNLFKGQYQFYSSGANSFIQAVADQIPNWSFTIHQTSGSNALQDRYRNFDVSDSNVYTLLTTDASEAYDCIFIFDNENRIIHAYDRNEPRESTDIFISYDNVIKNIKVTESTDNLATCLTVLGGNTLDIIDVNPLGTNKIYNFSYFKSDDWMSSELQNAITEWENKISILSDAYKAYVQNLNTNLAYLGELETYLAVLTTQMSGSKTEMDALIEAGLSTTEISASIAYGQTLIDATNLDISETNSTITEITEDMDNISDSLSFNPQIAGTEAVFTQQQYEQLQPFIIESSYINDNFSAIDGESASATFITSGSLYNQGIDALSRICQPRYTFDIDAVNFMMIKDFQVFKDQIELGKTITVELKPEQYLYPVILGYDINFDNPTEFKMVLGNRLHLDDDSFQYSELMTEAFSSARKTRLNYGEWGSASNHTSQFVTFMNSDINAGHNNIVADNGTIFDQTGLRGRVLSEGEYLPEQLQINKSIYFTENDWSTTKVGLGKITYSGFSGSIPSEADIITGSSVGLIANYLIGHLLANNNLVIGNTSGSFVVSGSTIQITIKSNTGHTKVELSPYSPINGIRIWKDDTPILYIGDDGTLYIRHTAI